MALEKRQTKNMKKFYIESEFESTATIYQIELLCSKRDRYVMHAAYINKKEAEKHIEWLIKNNYSEDVYSRYGKIYDAAIRSIAIFA